MSFKSHIPFHQQITGTLAVLYFSFVFIVGFTSLLLYQRNVQINELVNTQLPQLEFVYQFKDHLQLNNQLVTTLISSESANNLSDTFYKIKKNLNEISVLKSVNIRKISRLLDDINQVEDIVKRLRNNDPRNITLKKTTIVQLRILINTLITQIDDNKKTQLTLHQLVTMNGVNGYISAGNAIRHIEVSRILTQLNKTLLLLDEATLGFESLNISYSEEQLIDITRKIDLAISTWSIVLNADPIDLVTRNKIENLQTLLNVDQRVIGKWHGHLRLSEEVFNKVKIIHQQLEALTPTTNQPINIISSGYIIPEFISHIADDIDYNLSEQKYYYALISLLILSLLTFLLMLFKCRAKIQKYGENTVKLCERLIAQEGIQINQDEFIKTAEQLRIVGLIKQINKPEHNENQYQSLLNVYHQDLAFVREHHKVVIWHYKPYTHYINVTDFLMGLTPESDNKLSQWRHAFERKSFSEVIKIAKNVRDANRVQASVITLKNGMELNIVIGFDNGAWFGSFSHNQKVQQLQKTIVSLKTKHHDSEVLATQELTATVDRLSKMLLRAMIQGQGNSIDSNGTSLPVYRQLSRMYDWCRQRNIVSQLRHNQRSSQSSDISFKDELHAIVFNAISEAHLQKNKIFLQVDRLVLTFATIEQRLFHRMLLGIVRVILAELFNAKMLLDLQVVDNDKGKQIVQFVCMVSTAKPLKKIPELVNRLVNENNSSTSVIDIITYLKTLMQRLNIDHIQSQLADDGFSVIFSMPLFEQSIHPVEQVSKVSSLKNKSIISLGACQLSQAVIRHNINAAGGRAIHLFEIEKLTNEFTVKKLEHNPIDVIIVNDDIARNHLDVIKRYVQTLPNKLQPKLFVLQSPNNTPYHKQGLYNQSSIPLCKNSFQAQLLQLLKSESADNLLIDKDILSQYQYIPSRVEVLLAVSSPEDNQLLIRVLQWLGLQVHVVSQPVAMLKLWQSGRYLLLISEFAESPFMMLATGKNIKRGVFTFKDRLFDTPTDKILNTTKHWAVSTLPNVLDIKALVLLLEPWLKSKVSHSSKRVKQSTARVNSDNSLSEFLQGSNALDDLDQAYLKQAQLFIADSETDDKNHVLDMKKYAINQGSSELAAYMLDEYINDIERALSAIELAIDNRTLADIKRPNEIIVKVSQVMGANDLHVTAQSLHHLLDENVDNENDAKFKALVTTLRRNFKLLEDFAEAI